MSVDDAKVPLDPIKQNRLDALVTEEATAFSNLRKFLGWYFADSAGAERSRRFLEANQSEIEDT
jgi:hypothetical protein